ncbi:hypothetical protein [Filomicrobium sp.]|uniref:hypothetical protein n=1 Tax=Filomicrobium sp. TaxID=2024831 RepID=UPI002583AB11|nr:hypothetical protein [Filomicrobium sp.]MCV0371711.1 hypothetical protein [Filomicrobium sp.]
MTFWKWSKTASDNDDADTTVNWREGQGPSTINNSGRAMMAAAAKYRDDVSGMIETGGSATAYTVASNQNLTTLTDGFMVAFHAHATNTGAATLQVDSLTAKPLQSSVGVALVAGILRIGGIYTATYDVNEDSFIVHAAAVPDEFATGVRLLFPMTAVPTGWTKITTYNDYGLRIVSGDGAGTYGDTAYSTTFNASRTPTGAVDGHTLITSELASHDHGTRGNNFGTGGGGGGGAVMGWGGSHSTENNGGDEAHDHGLSMDAMNFNVQTVDVLIGERN